MNAPTPDEIRRRVQEEHVAIRAQIGSLLESAHAVSRSSDDAPRLWQPTIELCRTLQRHLDFEDEAFLPLLEDADAWGPVRVASIGDEHRAERAMIAALIEDIATGTRSDAELVDEIAWFLNALEHDMFDEERLALDGDVVSVECVAVDQIDG